MEKPTVKRFKDREFYDKSIYDQGFYVHCPKCDGKAIVKRHCRDVSKLNSDNCLTCPHAMKCRSFTFQLNFRCTSCGDIHSKRSKKIGQLSAKASCKSCERYFRVELDEDKKGHNYLNTKCPHCGVINTAKVHEAQGSGGYISYYLAVNVKGGTPMFSGYRLYFSASYKGNPVWAYNHVHLQYLIDFIEADVRETPGGGYFTNARKGQSHRLPKFMHLAKNRDGIVKVLRRLREK